MRPSPITSEMFGMDLPSCSHSNLPLVMSYANTFSLVMMVEPTFEGLWSGNQPGNLLVVLQCRSPRLK